MRSLLVILLCVCSAATSAQDLTGVWRGHFEQANMAQLVDPDARYKFEVQIGQSDKTFTGVTYSYHTTTFYGKASCYGSINPKTKKVFLEETKLLELQSSSGGACIMTLFLQYSKMGKEEVLEGHYTSISSTDSSQCGTGTVFLRRVETSDFYKEPFLVEEEKKKNSTRITPRASSPVSKPPTAKVKPPSSPAKPPVVQARPKPKPKTIQPKSNEIVKTVPQDSLSVSSPEIHQSIMVPRVLAARTNELVKTITTGANQISIKIYDNGTVDNDTVSVYVDKKLVISKARLTEEPILLKLALDDKTPLHELVMVAENLGEIPPNTSLMVVHAGDQDMEVHITSTEQKNAVVVFRYEPKK